MKNHKSNTIMGEIVSRETMQFTQITPSGNFAIHYDTKGYNAVENKDLNNNSIPDYIDSVSYYIDLAFQSEVIGLGFPFSPLDSNSGGTPMYDIYVKELAASPYYGLTQPEASVFSGNEFQFRSSYIVIDNDFQDDKYRTKGIDGLKITLFHEFNHSIQFYMTENDSPVLAEMSATFMEFRFFPEILDYLQWMKKWFDSPTTLSIANNYSADAGYGLSLFFQYTYKKYGDGIILNSWLNIVKGLNDIESLEKSLELKQSNLSEAFCEFTNWMYYTGANSRGNQYFVNASKLPELKLTDDLIFSNDNLRFEDNLPPFTFSPRRIILKNNAMSMNDTLLLFMSNADLENAKKKNSLKSLAKYSLYKENMPNTEKYDKLDYFYQDESDTNYCNTALELLGEKGIRYVEAYPNPFTPKLNETIHLPAPDNSKVYEGAEVEIYTPNMVVVFAGTKEVTVHKGQLVLNVNQNEIKQLDTGFYLFKSTVNGNSTVGKFMVKK
ncbi:hypothetical protein EP342_00485 [bacterium]|nr:MAG: hypothetical protein EP342_00485 [bacterium]